MRLARFSLLLCLLLIPEFSIADVKVGVGQIDITPPIGTPSAGCFERTGGMLGIHDPLFASAMVIDNGDKLVAFCSVDHMGFLRDMIVNVQQQVRNTPGLAKCEIYISGSHTHSGGGAYLNLGELGEFIAGPYDPNLVKICVDGAANAIVQAAKNVQPAKIGIGYGRLEGLTVYGGVFPAELAPPTDLVVIKAAKLDGSPLAVFFNYSLYPDILVYSSDEIPLSPDAIMQFSSDVVGYTREHIKSFIGGDVTPIFFNGAKGELLAEVPRAEDRFASCDMVGKNLAEKVSELWIATEVKEEIEISTYKHFYLFEPGPTPAGFVLPIDPYETEINLIVFDKTNAFVTIPAELSCSLDPVLKNAAGSLGFKLSILDIVNDAHGYIYSPESWRIGPDEVEFSWGGEMYGKTIQDKIFGLLQEASLK